MPNIKIDVFPASYSRPSPLCKKIKSAKSIENENILVPEIHQLTSGTGNATAGTKLGIPKSSMDAEDILVIGQVSTQSSNRSSPHHGPSKFFWIYEGLTPRGNLDWFPGPQYAVNYYQWCRNWGSQGGHWPPQYFSDQLTLFEPGRADYPHLLLLAPPMFFTFRHHWLLRL